MIIKAKILIQQLLQQLDWDEPIASGNEQEWLHIQAELPVLGEIRVPLGCAQEGKLTR